jgi:hypothetical protein
MYCAVALALAPVALGGIFRPMLYAWCLVLGARCLVPGDRALLSTCAGQTPRLVKQTFPFRRNPLMKRSQRKYAPTIRQAGLYRSIVAQAALEK